MQNSNILILGAGISALGAGYSLLKRGCEPILLERNNTYGGLCNNFEIEGFRFDKFIHLAFSQNEIVNHIFDLSSPKIIRHIPVPYNLYNGIWIKHPAQNNIYPLEEKKKKLIIEDFKNRPKQIPENIKNYEEWLKIQYGNYFAEHFPIKYTRKYWMHEASELETKWIGNRLYQPSLDEVIQGSKSAETPITYYAKEMRYPEKGGYKTFLNELTKGLDIRYNKEIVKIDPRAKKVKCTDESEFNYTNLISSLPLPEVIRMLEYIPSKILEASQKLKFTSGYLVSIGLKTKNIPPYLWWYIYDEDILPARVYSPSLKSTDNAPEGCSSLQLEIYCKEDQYIKSEIYTRSIKKLIDLNIITESEILFVDIRFEKYANVIFDHNIYDARKVVREYLNEAGIYTIGRFGEWEYFWSDQSLLSGMQISNYINE